MCSALLVLAARHAWQPGYRSCEGLIFHLQAARLDFRVAPPIRPSSPWRHVANVGTQIRSQTLGATEALHICQIPRDSSHPVDRPRSDGRRGTQPTDLPGYPNAAATHPPSISHSSPGARTHTRFAHACTPARGWLRQTCRVDCGSPVKPPYWQTACLEPRHRRTPRRVPYGQPGWDNPASRRRAVDWGSGCYGL